MMSESPAVSLESGTFQLPDGTQYIGEFARVEGVGRVRQGRGQYISLSERYNGSWRDDKMHGEGSYTFASGCLYTGSFVDGAFEGQGTYTWPDGSRYTGQWAGSKMHGEGSYTDANKVVSRGTFHNGLYDSGRSYVSLRPASLPA